MSDDPAQRACISRLQQVMHGLSRHRVQLSEWHTAKRIWEDERAARVKELREVREKMAEEARAAEDKKRGFLSALLARRDKRPDSKAEVKEAELIKAVEKEMSPAPPPPAPPQGLYIFGDVGTGKSLVMDLFLTAMRRAEPSINTQRLHFHAFTTQVHELIHRSGVTDQTSTELLPSVAHELLGLPQCEAQTGPALLCFDEFQCNDIFTATILQALVGYVLDRGVTLVATSNRAPMELNKHLLRGAQKALTPPLYLPASPLYLPTPRLYLPYISPHLPTYLALTPPLHLPTPPLYLPTTITKGLLVITKDLLVITKGLLVMSRALMC